MGEGVNGGDRYSDFNIARALAKELEFWMLKRTHTPLPRVMKEIAGEDWQELTNEQLLERVQIHRRRAPNG